MKLTNHLHISLYHSTPRLEPIESVYVLKKTLTLAQDSIAIFLTISENNDSPDRMGWMDQTTPTSNSYNGDTELKNMDLNEDVLYISFL